MTRTIRLVVTAAAALVFGSPPAFAASDYTGSTAGIAPHQNATISVPVGTDVRNSASVRTPMQRLADYTQYLMQKAGLLDQVNTWSQSQTISSGDVRLTSGATQAMRKSGGQLSVGTDDGSALDLYTNGVSRVTIGSDGDQDHHGTKVRNLGNPATAQDAATKGYIDGFSFLTAAALPGPVADLNAPPYGYARYEYGAANAPSQYGSVLTWNAMGGTNMTPASGRWLFQLAFGTYPGTTMYYRNNINNGGWNPWVAISPDVAASALSLVQRDANGRSLIVRPQNADTDEIANASWVRDMLAGTGTSAATVNALVRRDANGRAQFADPSASADAATKGWVDALSATATPTLSSGWTEMGATNRLTRSNKLVTLQLHAEYVNASASWGNVTTLPVGFRPAAGVGALVNLSLTSLAPNPGRIGWATIDTSGVLRVLWYYNPAATNIPAVGTVDTIDVSVTFGVP